MQQRKAREFQVAAYRVGSKRQDGYRTLFWGRSYAREPRPIHTLLALLTPKCNGNPYSQEVDFSSDAP